MSFATLNLPVWDIGGMSGGLFIAIIAVAHVFISHFAVGGGFFLVAAEYKGIKENSYGILLWVKKHTKFFLLITMVFGSMTGVGIWLIISLVVPAGISMLIREFVYAWAAEWVFFLAEIITLILYATSFPRLFKGQMSTKNHLLLGIGYGVFAFLSLVIINGILTFMLTPGEWIQDKNFWSALFNPTYYPSLLFRSCLSLILAGLFGLFTAVSSDNPDVKSTMVKFCAKWITFPFIGLLIATYWYFSSLPEAVQISMQRGTKDIAPYLDIFVIVAPLLFLAGILLFIGSPKKVGKITAICMLILGFMTIGSFEWVRETTRRPWIVYGFMYSNGISVTDGQKIKEEGFYENSGWARLVANADEDTTTTEIKKPFSELTPEGRAQFSHFLFKAQCANCHGIHAPKIDIIPHIVGRTPLEIEALLGGQGIINSFMPPVFANAEERKALAEWLFGLSESIKQQKK